MASKSDTVASRIGMIAAVEHANGPVLLEFLFVATAGLLIYDVKLVELDLEVMCDYLQERINRLQKLLLVEQAGHCIISACLSDLGK